MYIYMNNRHKPEFLVECGVEDNLFNHPSCIDIRIDEH